MKKLVLLRHGESVWNKENRFTGWTDVGLTAEGEREARAAGRLMAEAGLAFDLAYTSVLKRAIKTLWLALEEMDLMWIPVVNSWRLNERHYGALQGLNKAETAAKYGDDQVLLWRRSYDVPPPSLESSNPEHPANDARYDGLPRDVLPATECLKDVVARVLPYWYDTVAPQLLAGQNVLITAHGNSLRALLKHLEGIADDAIVDVNIPTGAPRRYEFDAQLNVTSGRRRGAANRQRFGRRASLRVLRAPAGS